MKRLTDQKKNYCEWIYCCEKDMDECGGEQGAGCVPYHLYKQLQHLENLAEQERLVKLDHKNMFPLGEAIQYYFDHTSSKEAVKAMERFTRDYAASAAKARLAEVEGE